MVEWVIGKLKPKSQVRNEGWPSRLEWQKSGVIL
jgi:hypothetical protein